MSPVLFFLIQAAIVLAAVLLLLWVVARGMRDESRWQDFNAGCACPLRFIRTQDGSGHVLKQFHASLCTNRPASNGRGGYAEPEKVVTFLTKDTFGDGPPDMEGGAS